MKYNLIGKMIKWPIRWRKGKENEILAIHFVKDRQKNVYLLTQNHHDITQERILMAIVLVFITLIGFMGSQLRINSSIIFVITIIVAFIFHKIVPSYVHAKQIKEKGILLGNDNSVLAKYFYDLISQNNLKVKYQNVPMFGQSTNDPYLSIGEMVYNTPYIVKEGSGKHWSLIIILLGFTATGIIMLFSENKNFSVPTIVVIFFGYMAYYSFYTLFASMTKERTRQVELVNYIVNTFANKNKF